MLSNLRLTAVNGVSEQMMRRFSTREFYATSISKADGNLNIKIVVLLVFEIRSLSYFAIEDKQPASICGRCFLVTPCLLAVVSRRRLSFSRYFEGALYSATFVNAPRF